ncbi:hypothetical protein GWG65_09285 [Bradyrhizobium sp. CSA207]|nr:hypothetical protein [Bradyrhizobium sp. CSA207]
MCCSYARDEDQNPASVVRIRATIDLGRFNHPVDNLCECRAIDKEANGQIRHSTSRRRTNSSDVSPVSELILLESGGDNLASTFSRDLTDFWMFVIDVAGGDDIPRKRGPGVIRADLLVINKGDLAIGQARSATLD